MRRNFLNGPVLGLIVVIGCRGDGGGDGGDRGASNGPPRGGEVTTVEELIQAAWDTECRLLFHCAAITPVAEVLYESEDHCRNAPEWRWNRRPSIFSARYRGLIRLESEGLVRVDPERVAQCLAAVGECGFISVDRFAPCRGMIKGMQKTGEACNLNEECEGEAFCRFTDHSCPGVCAPRLPAGSACTIENDVCAEGTVCFTVDEAGHAVELGSCTTFVRSYAAGSGEVCGGKRSNDSYESISCPAELFCHYPAEPRGLETRLGSCGPPLALGAPCHGYTDACAGDARCLGPDGARTCQGFRWLSAGEACEESDLTRGCDLRADLACRAGRCQPIGDGSPDTCSRAHGPLLCKEGFLCQQDQCVALREGGAPCEIHIQCRSGACDPRTKTCRERYCDAI